MSKISERNRFHFSADLKLFDHNTVTVCRSAGETPDCPEHSSVCHDRNKEVWSHYSSAASTPLASSTAANHLQVGNDHLQMPSWSGAVLPGWRVHPHFSHHRQVAAAVYRQRDTRRAAYKVYDRLAKLWLCRAGWHGTAFPSNCGRQLCPPKHS